MASFRLQFAFKFTLFFLLIGFALSLICHLAYLYPLCSDEYHYLYICGTNSRITSLSDVIQSQLFHYVHNNGRFVVHAFLQLFLMWGKEVFLIFLASCYLLCVFFITRGINKNRLIAATIIALTFWIALPVPGQTLLWECGAFNYIFTTFLLLFFLTCVQSEKRFFIILALPLALAVGNSHEGSSFGLFISMCCFAYLDRKRKKSILFYLAISFIFIGFLSNVLSPGSLMRIDNTAGITENEGSIISRSLALCAAAYHFINAIERLNIDYLCIIFLLFLCLYLNYRYYRNNKTVHFLGFSLALGACVNFIIPFAGNVVYPRAFYGACTLALISIYHLLIPIVSQKRFYTAALITTALILNIGVYMQGKEQILLLREYEGYIVSQLKQQHSIIYIPSHLSQVSGRFVESYGNSHNYTENGKKSFFYKGPLFYSVIQDPWEQRLLQAIDFEHLPSCRIMKLSSDSYLIRLKGKHKHDIASYEKEETNGSLASRLRSKLASSTTKKHLIYNAAVTHHDNHYILVVSPEKNITLEVLYESGEREVFRLNGE